MKSSMIGLIPGRLTAECVGETNYSKICHCWFTKYRSRDAFTI